MWVRGRGNGSTLGGRRFEGSLSCSGRVLRSNCCACRSRGSARVQPLVGEGRGGASSWPKGGARLWVGADGRRSARTGSGRPSRRGRDPIARSPARSLAAALDRPLKSRPAVTGSPLPRRTARSPLRTRSTAVRPARPALTPCWARARRTWDRTRPTPLPRPAFRSSSSSSKRRPLSPTHHPPFSAHDPRHAPLRRADLDQRPDPAPRRDLARHAHRRRPGQAARV